MTNVNNRSDVQVKGSLNAGLNSLNASKSSHAPGKKGVSSSDHKVNTRDYIAGSGAISIAFLLDLLELNTKMKNDMATLSAKTTEVQSKVIQTQADEQVTLYNKQAGELTMQGMTSIATAITSGVGGLVSLGGMYTSTNEGKLAAQSEEHLESFNKISSKSELFTGDEDGNRGAFANKLDGHSEDRDLSTPEHQKNMQELRERMMNGGATTKSFNNAKFEDAELSIERADGTETYKVKDIIRSSTPKERTDIAKSLATNRDNALKSMNDATNRMQMKQQMAKSFLDMGGSFTNAYSQTKQASLKTDEGKAQSQLAIMQGTGSLLGNAQSTLSSARDSSAGKIGEALQTLRQLVATEIRG